MDNPLNASDSIWPSFSSNEGGIPWSTPFTSVAAELDILLCLMTGLLAVVMVVADVPLLTILLAVSFDSRANLLR